VNVGLAPACVKTCPTGAIQFGAKEEMILRGAKRVGDLNERGFQKAALYNPKASAARTSCTCCSMATSRSCITVCRAIRRSVPWVTLWKGITKPLLALGMGIAVLGAFFHYITRGPKEVDDNAHRGG
jgi:ferredoxin